MRPNSHNQWVQLLSDGGWTPVHPLAEMGVFPAYRRVKNGIAQEIAVTWGQGWTLFENSIYQDDGELTDLLRKADSKWLRRSNTSEASGDMSLPQGAGVGGGGMSPGLEATAVSKDKSRLSEAQQAPLSLKEIPPKRSPAVGGWFPGCTVQTPYVLKLGLTYKARKKIQL